MVYVTGQTGFADLWPPWRSTGNTRTANPTYTRFLFASTVTFLCPVIRAALFVAQFIYVYAVDVDVFEEQTLREKDL